MDFKKIIDRAKTELNLTYKDILRTVFSKRFVRRRRIYLAAALGPFFLYIITTSEKTYQDEMREYKNLKFNEIEEIIDKTYPIDTKYWKTGLSEDVRIFQR